MKVLSDSLVMAERLLRNLARQPWWIAITLAQPIVYLVLYAQLFKRIVDIPGFNAPSYITFVTPGIVIMTALFAGGWNGMGMIQDIDRGIMDRFLVSPVSRVAMILGRLVAMAVTTLIQSAILLTLGFLLGARFDGGVTGILLLVLSGVLLAAPMAALSNAMALVLRKPESVIGASNFIILPMTFLSPVFMAKNLMPRWIQTAAAINPVGWSVDAAREALRAQPDWRIVLSRFAYLVALCVVSAWLATRAFQSYQRSV